MNPYTRLRVDLFDEVEDYADAMGSAVPPIVIISTTLYLTHSENPEDSRRIV